MPSIHKNLVLDHIYISASAEEFKELTAVFTQFGCASHSVVKADDDSWEALYIQTRGQNYLEILNLRRTGRFGFCQRAFSPMAQDSRHIMNDFPDLPWKTFERSLDGQKWFTALSCDNYLDLTTPFNSWVMYYHQRDMKQILPLQKDYEIARMTYIQLSAHPNLIERVKMNSKWFNAKVNFANDQMIFDVQTYYAEPFQLVINFDNKNEGFQFKKIEFETAQEVTLKPIDLKFFTFLKSGNKLILEKINC